MDYFDVHDIPKGLLRLKFRSVSESETELLAQLFTPVASVLLASRMNDCLVRIGFKGLKDSGKTTLARRMAECISDNVFPDVKLHGWSNKYIASSGEVLLHYDIEAIQVRKSLYPPDNLSMRIMREFAQHERTYHSADMHLVEWPEKDPKNSKLNVLWNVVRLEAEERDYSLICTEEITKLPEYQQFLEAAQPFMIK